MPRPRAHIDLAHDAKMAARGLTVPERAKIHGVDPATLRRAIGRGPDPAPEARAPVATMAEAEGDDVDDIAARKRRAQRAIRSAYAEGGAQALRAAGLDLADIARAQAEQSYADTMGALEQAGQAAAALALNAALRRRIDAGDVALGELYRASAQAGASEDDRAALAAWLDAHPEVKAEVVAKLEAAA